MKKKIKLLFLIKTAAFILSTWRSNYASNLNVLKKYLDENNSNVRKLDTRIYQLLVKYKQNHDSRILGLQEVIPYNGENERNHICNNEKRHEERKKLSNKSLLNNSRIHRHGKKNKYCIFATNKYSHLERKIFKELDYQNFLKNNRIIKNKLHKKIMFKKYGLRFSLPLLLFSLLSISLILDLFFKCGFINGLFAFLNNYSLNNWMKGFNKSSFFDPIRELCKFTGSTSKTKSTIITHFFGIIIYVIPFFILGVTLISWIIYYHNKVKKFEKFKFRKR
ncbi:fam-l protein [Plasmodium malariae]|uniref:Fam-l protein n=1 Tax=Plasmodium malariae TaxID=5858 RepID=A0A1D3JGY5_PLAMA|nr:fam-l protein [Plasmodium malariae]SBT85512.1 fam-l protein [Plasmodium malariae]